MKDLENSSLDEVLKAYNICENGRCEECLYEFAGYSCIGQMNKDLHKYVILLKKENMELIDKLFRSEQSM